METLDTINLTQDQRKLLSEIDNVALRQMVRDHIVDQQFRRDIFAKGPMPLAKGAVQDAWLKTRFVLTRKAADVPRQVQGMRYKVNLQPEIYDPVIAAMSRGPRKLRDMMGDPALAKLGLGRVMQALTFLMAQGTCQPCLPESGFAERKLQTDLFNRAVAEHARHEQKFSHFASPVTGGGIAADRISQLIWLARHDQEQDGARFVWNALSKAGQRMMKDGKPLTTEAENLAEIRRRIESFEADALPLWTSLSLGFGAPSASTPAKRPMRV